MSTGELLVVRAAMKPLSTLNRPTLRTVDVETKEETVSFKERTDVTAVPALGVVAETMVALVLASEAQFELDVRSEGPEELETLTAKVEQVVALRQRAGVHAAFEIIGRRPAGSLPIDHAWVQLALECISDLGLIGKPTAGSTDANIPLSEGLPAIVLGITTGGGAHTPQEYIDTGPVSQGLQQIFCFVRRLLGTT